jgi:phosphatidylinositol alpha-1,6-mannosyltransferase
VCINPGVDAAAYQQSPAEIARYRASLQWPQETVILATLARMEPRKNHAQVIRAVSELRAQNVPVAYICGGDGPERARLEALAGELGLSKWVRFTGAVPEAEKKLIFGACDIHVMASIQVGEMIEGFGIVFIEAAAAGKPSISGRNGGQAEAVIHDRTGLVVDGASLGELTTAIRRLAENESRRREMGEEGRRWAQQHDYQEIARATVDATADVRAKLMR